MTYGYDNGVVQRMQILVMKHIVKLGMAGCQVLQVRFNGAKAVIHVEPFGNLSAHSRDGEFAVIEEGPVRVVWRDPPEQQGEVG